MEAELDLEVGLKIFWILVGTGRSPRPLISANSLGLLDLISSCLILNSSGSAISLVAVKSLVSFIDLVRVPYKSKGSDGVPLSALEKDD